MTQFNDWVVSKDGVCLKIEKLGGKCVMWGVIFMKLTFRLVQFELGFNSKVYLGQGWQR